MQPDDIIQQQIAYYRARAGEYDEWFYRLGRYDHGAELNQNWFDEVSIVVQALEGIGPVGSILEIACGTGIWTERLAKLGTELTAIDASPEVLALNRERVNGQHVTYLQDDIFAWEPERQYDLVFFSFWLSHVPPEQFDAFIAKVARAMRLGGRLFIIDSLPEQTGTARNNPLRDDEETYRTRILNDGSTYTIVKVFYEPDRLNSDLARFGIDADIRKSGVYFLYGSGIKR